MFHILITYPPNHLINNHLIDRLAGRDERPELGPGAVECAEHGGGAGAGGGGGRAWGRGRRGAGGGAGARSGEARGCDGEDHTIEANQRDGKGGRPMGLPLVFL